MKKIIACIYHGVFLLPSIWSEYKDLLKNLGSVNCRINKRKFEAYLIMHSHIIEKGMSFKDIRYGYGEKKILDILKNLSAYYSLHRDSEFSSWILSIIKKYIEFNKDYVEINEEIIKRYEDLKEIIKPIFIDDAGFKHVKRENIINQNIDFDKFVKSRHSVRNFDKNNFDFDLVLKAIKMAEWTPSACNRQPWNVHLIKDEKLKIDILDFQTGARQFKEEMSCVILITSSHNYFFGDEYHQPYLNGGMFAMTLIYALHSLGLASIPLNMGIGHRKLKTLYKVINIPENEIPLVLLGVGGYADEFNVATSHRISYKDFITIY